MKLKLISILCFFVITSFVIACATEGERRQVGKGAGVGAAVGAVTGLALGAATGDAGIAAAGMAVGAAAGAGAGAMYEYDQAREDRRTQTMADAIGGARKGETADDAGKRHLEDFLGEWNLDIWALDAEGKKITATGKAKGIMESRETARIDYTDIKAAGIDQIMTGTSVLEYAPDRGFALENTFSISPEPRRYVGEYIPDKNAYNFYPATNAEGETLTGVIRSNVRIELRVSGSNLMVAETYTMLDGKEVQIQSYRFTKQQ